MRNYLCTVNNFSLLPNRTIYRGDNKFDFYADETRVPQIVKEKLKEVKEDATLVSKKSGESTKISAELKKEGKPEAKNEDKFKDKDKKGAEK